MSFFFVYIKFLYIFASNYNSLKIMKNFILTISLLLCTLSLTAGNRYNFNATWRMTLGDVQDAQRPHTNDATWKEVNLPYSFNQGEAYSRVCGDLSDTVMWYRKHFVLPESARDHRIFIEFEGVRFGAQVFLNGQELGWADNGITAFGFDLTPYINYNGENVLAVRVDSDWRYREHKTSYDENGKELHSTFQWNDKNFFCNYGGINKNVWLHVMSPVYQTLPLYSNLGTTGVYVYAKDFDIANRTATLWCESQVVNSSSRIQKVTCQYIVEDKDGNEVARFKGYERGLAAGDTTIMKACKALSDLHFWSWGYGYLYTVTSQLLVDDRVVDSQTIRTGFRKTEFKNGMFYLNDRVLHLKGFAQRSTNEWPALGISVPAWMSDYSNRLILGCNGNLVRWMHVTPSKQDIQSFDRLGLLMAMPAGDAEKDVTGRRWQQRCEVMRDAIIYNRNNPSIIFYEGGNNFISEEHMAELKAIRDQYDPNGGRAAGCRNMLYSNEAEYGGEMLYVNKSASKPMFMMEYNRDEGIRRYWDRWSYPYHEEGEGPLYRGDRAVAYNHNQDGLAIENVVRWNEYWMARPGTGRRVNAGGAKIIFSDSNTHARGEKNYRTSGDVDPMRIAKDSWYVHQAMWDGWVDTEHDHTYIVGHWNYEAGDKSGAPVTKPVYVVSTGDEVELFLNNRSLGKGLRSSNFLFTWPEVLWQPGTLRAVSFKQGKEVSSYELVTVEEPVKLRMHWIEAPEMFLADGSDVRIAEIEAVDNHGRRHPLAHDMVSFKMIGPATYLGGCSGVVSEEEKMQNAAATPSGEEGIISEGGHSKDNNKIGSTELMLEAGVVRVMIRSVRVPGNIRLFATPTTCDGHKSNLKGASLAIQSFPCSVQNGFYVDKNGERIEADRSANLPLFLDRGETPSTPSYVQHYTYVPIQQIEVPVNADKVAYLTDDNEANDTKQYPMASKWSSDGLLENAWLKVKLERPASIRQISLRLDGFRSTSYPLQVYAAGKLVWEGYTPKTLGDCYLDISEPVLSDTYEIRMIGPATVKEAFASMTELAAKKKVSVEASKSNVLSIFELELKE